MTTIEFPKRQTKEEIKAIQFTQSIDESVRFFVADGMDPHLMCVLLATRLGEAIKATHAAQIAEGAAKFGSVSDYVDFITEYVVRFAKGEQR